MLNKFENNYKIECYNGLNIQKQWKKVVGFVNVEHSRLGEACPEKILGKHGVK